VARLIYSTSCSLDGYIERDGHFEWAAPSEEVHAFVNEQERAAGTLLYGRRMYETMVAWETLDTATESAAMREYAEIWRAADKVVFSRTLDDVSSARTRLERDFDPAAIRELKASAEADITVGGSGLAAEALRAGLVDEVGTIVVPVLVGGGTPAFSADVRLDLELLDHRRFDNGMVYLRYGAAGR
jgi:dihydrofolate reductase